MRIVVIGTGYVGLTHGTCLAELGNQVTCIDIDSDKITRLQQGIIPIFEPGLSELVIKNTQAGRLHFSITVEEHINDADIVFIAVGTPPGKDGHADLQYVQNVAHQIGQCMSQALVIVNKSTVPVGTGDMVKGLITEELQKRGVSLRFDVISNPEFLKEGTAVDDFFHGDRIVIGSNDRAGKGVTLLQQLYAPLNETQLIVTDLYTAEIIKYSANALLAVEISFINMLSQLCEKVGADITLVSAGLKSDSRIGKKAFLNAGPGFGGSCFPKDVLEFIQTFQDYGLANGILESTMTINDQQKQHICHKVSQLLPDLQGKTVSILGLAFKADTDDIRYAASLTLVDYLITNGALVQVYDPQAMDNFKRFYPTLVYTTDAYTCCQGADCIVLLTERKEFCTLDRKRIATSVSQPHLIDTRNMLESEAVRALGFTYLGTGR